MQISKLLPGLCLTISIPLSAQKLPTVALDQLAEGNYWVWRYDHIEGYPRSWEKYQVTYQSGSIVTLTMATKFSIDDDYQVHHQMTVDLDDCLSAHGDLYRKPYWNLIDFSYLAGDTWIKAGDGSNVQAFEEKFNCVPSSDNHIQYETNFTSQYLLSLGKQDLFQNKYFHSDTNQIPTWFLQNHEELTGVAGFKEFIGGDGKAYHFQLVDWYHK